MTNPDPPSQPPIDPRRVREASLILGGLASLLVATLWWISREPPRDRPRFAAAPGSGRELTGDYIGSQACGECHRGESALFARSGHSQTLHLAADPRFAARLAGRTVADPESPAVSWSYARREGDLVVERSEAADVKQFVLDYVLGSGHHATTFLSLVEAPVPIVLEHRLSHYSEGDILKITPGQGAPTPGRGTTPEGRRRSPEDTLKCFQCHSTRTSASGSGIVMSEVIPNVSCERCHGPARQHVEAAHAGRTGLRMPADLAGGTAESQLELCGQCHRHPSHVAPAMIRPENTALARFQPVGLSQSACYTRSAGALSCVTCHDPHDRASSDRASYAQACLQCHAAPAATACTVSPQTGCVGCHMPKVDTGQHVLFTDHWIRIR